MRRIVAILLAMVAISSCHDRAEYLIGPTTVGNYIVFEAPSSVKADGISVGILKVQITERSPKKLDAVFTSTTGTLIGGANNGTSTTGMTATVPISDDGTAAVLLRSDSEAKQAEVTVTVDKITLRKTVEFSATRSDDLFTFTIEPGELPADGYSRATIGVRLLAIGNLQQRLVKITTTAGKLFGEKSVTSTQIETTATESGTAFAELESENVPRNAIVTVTAVGHSQSREVRFRPADPAQSLTLTVSRASAPADGQTLSRLTAKVPLHVPTPVRTVTFKTTVGTFQNGQTTDTVVADSAGEARVDLKSIEIGLSIVTASIPGASAESSVNFGPAYPTQIILTAERPTIHSQSPDSVEVRASLLRASGKVSATIFPQFTAVTASGTPIGTFTDLRLTTVDGIVTGTAKFNVGGSTYQGLVTLKAVVPGSGLSASTSITVIP
jgi:hypothetical protein